MPSSTVNKFPRAKNNNKFIVFFDVYYQGRFDSTDTFPSYILCEQYAMVFTGTHKSFQQEHTSKY